MKKYIKQIILLAFVVTFVSCTDDEEIAMTSVGGSISGLTTATPGAITRLDNGVPITFKVTTKEGVTATSVEVYRNTAATSALPIVLGTKVADATIGPDGKAAVYNSSTLGSFDVFPTASAGLTGTTGTFPLAVKATFSDGSTTLIPYVQTVGKGITWRALGANGKFTSSATSGVTSFRIDDPTPAKVSFAVLKQPATVITSVVGQFKKNTGAYTALPNVFTATTDTQTIDLAAIPYSTYGGLAVGDEITYKFIVTAGTQVDFLTTKVTIKNQVFGGSSDGQISNDLGANQFSMLTGNNYASTNTTDGEIMFVSPFGIAKDGATDITFVKTSPALDYDTTDLFQADAAYTAGTKVTSLTNLVSGDVIVYKIIRSVNFGTADEPEMEDVTYYGLLQIEDKIAGTTSQELVFSYKEGILTE